MAESLGTVLGRIAASTDPMPERGLGLLTALRSVVPFDAAWLALTDPRGSRYRSLARLDLDDDAVDFLGRPTGGHDHAASGADRLSPAGFRESVPVALIAPGGRRIGLLILLFGTTAPPSPTMCRRLAELAPELAMALDPMPALLATTRVVPGVAAGTVLCDDGSTEALPGYDGDPLLVIGSPVLAIAGRRLDEGLLCSSFLWPLGGGFAPDGHARITVVAAPDDVPSVLGAVLISPAPVLHGLTPRELEVLGLVIDGCSNQEIADTLIVAPRTVAAHVEHLLLKLDVRTRTMAAVRAEREGLYVPLASHPVNGGTRLTRRD